MTLSYVRIAQIILWDVMPYVTVRDNTSACVIDDDNDIVTLDVINNTDMIVLIEPVVSVIWCTFNVSLRVLGRGDYI